MRLFDTTLFFCLARNLIYIRRGYIYKQNLIKTILLLRRKNYDNFS